MSDARDLGQYIRYGRVWICESSAQVENKKKNLNKKELLVWTVAQDMCCSCREEERQVSDIRMVKTQVKRR